MYTFGEDEVLTDNFSSAFIIPHSKVGVQYTQQVI